MSKNVLYDYFDYIFQTQIPTFGSFVFPLTALTTSILRQQIQNGEFLLDSI